MVDDSYEFCTKLEHGSLSLKSTDTSSRNSKQIDCPKSDFVVGRFSLCREFVKVDYTPTGETSITITTYKTATVILREFGGVVKLMATAVSLLYSVYSMGREKGFLKENIFTQDPGRVRSS